MLLGCSAPALIRISIINTRALPQLASFTGIALVALYGSQYVGSSRRIAYSWLAFDFRCLHARQAVEAFRDLADEAGGEPTRLLTPVGNGARTGGPGRGGDMAGDFVVYVTSHQLRRVHKKLKSQGGRWSGGVWRYLASYLQLLKVFHRDF